MRLRRSARPDGHQQLTLAQRTSPSKSLEDTRKQQGFYLSGYVLMPEHVHLVLTEPKPRPLATTLSVLKGETSKILKGDRLHLWQSRYYDFSVLSQNKRIEKLRYLHRNPVARGLVAHPEEWPWSSYRHYLTGDPGRVEIESA